MTVSTTRQSEKLNLCNISVFLTQCSQCCDLTWSKGVSSLIRNKKGPTDDTLGNVGTGIMWCGMGERNSSATALVHPAAPPTQSECGKRGSPMTCVSVGGHKSCALGLKSCIKIQLTSHEKCINCFVQHQQRPAAAPHFSARGERTPQSPGGTEEEGICWSRQSSPCQPATENTILWNFFRSKTGSRKRWVCKWKWEEEGYLRVLLKISVNREWTFPILSGNDLIFKFFMVFSPYLAHSIHFLAFSKWWVYWGIIHLPYNPPL